MRVADRWFLDSVTRGIDPDHEANTSRYVHEVLLECFNWPFEEILPQKESRGFIDYKLRFTGPEVEVHVEVKRFDQPLKDEMIRKYIVRKGPMREGFQVGVLTNFRDWQVFVAGPRVREACAAPMALVLWHDIEGESDIAKLDSLIGHRQNGHLRELRAALGESDEIVGGLLRRSQHVTKALRRALSEIAERHGLDVPIPQLDSCRYFTRVLLEGSWDSSCPFTRAKWKVAVGSEEVASAVDDEIVRLFGARSSVQKIRRTARVLLKDEDPEDVD